MQKRQSHFFRIIFLEIKTIWFVFLFNLVVNMVILDVLICLFLDITTQKTQRMHAIERFESVSANGYFSLSFSFNKKSVEIAK